MITHAENNNGQAPEVITHSMAARMASMEPSSDIPLTVKPGAVKKLLALPLFFNETTAKLVTDAKRLTKIQATSRAMAIALLLPYSSEYRNSFVESNTDYETRHGKRG